MQGCEEDQFDHPDSALALTIVASCRQRGNKLLDSIKDFRIVYAKIVPDYLLSPTNCVIFISLAYHRLHSDYLPYRIQQLKKQYRVRMLLCLVDLEDSGNLSPHSCLQLLYDTMDHRPCGISMTQRDLTHRSKFADS